MGRVHQIVKSEIGLLRRTEELRILKEYKFHVPYCKFLHEIAKNLKVNRDRLTDVLRKHNHYNRLMKMLKSKQKGEKIENKSHKREGDNTKAEILEMAKARVDDKIAKAYAKEVLKNWDTDREDVSLIEMTRKINA